MLLFCYGHVLNVFNEIHRLWGGLKVFKRIENYNNQGYLIDVKIELIINVSVTLSTGCQGQTAQAVSP
jgi:hypothetical protein